MERAGATPHLLLPHRLLPEDESEARAEAASRGWALEDFPYPAHSVLTRVRQHARMEMNRHSAALVARMRELAAQAAFTQFEEIGAMQYALDAPRELPTVVSTYNVDSWVELQAALELGSRGARARARYRARRLLATERRSARRADLCVCVSREDRAHFVENGARDVLVVPNGVDDELFELPEEPAGEPRALFFGSYLWEANARGLARYLDEVWPRVIRDIPNAELRVAGPGPTERIREAAARTARVTILGFVPDLLAELRKARLVVAPIWFGGGTRIKVLEALAAARPVVGTSVGVERIGFEHDRHGLVADDPEVMAAATVRILSDTAAARRFARNGRLLARGFRWSETTAELEDRYRELVDRRRIVPGAAGVVAPSRRTGGS
jgi:glycosyltransferase involved in cell wall biosynthesis